MAFSLVDPRLLRAVSKKATPDDRVVNQPCTASYAGLTGVSVILHKSLCEGRWIAGSSPAMTEETPMNELDFSGKQILVVGGSSGIGNGIAQALRARDARVSVGGMRAGAADYPKAEGSDLEGLGYAQLDVSDPGAIENFQPSFDRLDVVLAQGAVIYRRGEFGFATGVLHPRPHSGSRWRVDSPMRQTRPEPEPAPPVTPSRILSTE
jgi:hypothetical protein